VLMRIFRICKTLICPPNSMLQDAGHRILLDPIALCLLLNQLEFSDRQSSRLQNRVRIGSTVVLRNVATKERLILHIVKDQKACPEQGIVSFTSIIGSTLIGLRRGDVARVNTAQGELKFKLLKVNYSATNLSQ